MLRLVSALLAVIAWTLTPVLAGTCYGLENCTACKSCRYCRNCNSGGELCGVWHATHGQQGSSNGTPGQSAADTQRRDAAANGYAANSVPATPANSYAANSISATPPNGYAVNTVPPIAPPSTVRSKAKFTEYRTSVSREDPFVANVRRRIAASWSSFPTCDLTARIYFEIDPSGDLVNLKVLSASGDPEGIGQAVNAIKSATPFGTPRQTERFAINFKDGQMDYSPEVQRFQTTSVQLLPPSKVESIVPSTSIENR